MKISIKEQVLQPSTIYNNRLKEFKEDVTDSQNNRHEQLLNRLENLFTALEESNSLRQQLASKVSNEQTQQLASLLEDIKTQLKTMENRQHLSYQLTIIELEKADKFRRRYVRAALVSLNVLLLGALLWLMF
jgi:predicted nuclease with TOPRIM domain